MCKANEILKNLISTYQEANAEHNRLNKELSRCDLIQQDLLHLIEADNFNAAEGYFYAKKIKEVRMERRNIKLEIATIQKLIENIKPSDTLVKLDKLGKNIEQQEYNLKNHTDYKPRILKAVV